MGSNPFFLLLAFCRIVRSSRLNETKVQMQQCGPRTTNSTARRPMSRRLTPNPRMLNHVPPFNCLFFPTCFHSSLWVLGLSHTLTMHTRVPPCTLRFPGVPTMCLLLDTPSRCEQGGGGWQMASKNSKNAVTEHLIFCLPNKHAAGSTVCMQFCVTQTCLATYGLCGIAPHGIMKEWVA